MVARLTIEELNGIVACPVSRKPMCLVEGQDGHSPDGTETYHWINGNWNLIPSSYRSSPLWPAWDQLQHNGEVSYQMDPEHNLAVGVREDASAFARFCRFDGLVLDVGCGPQAWPAYFEGESARTRYIGVDPLIGQSSPRYIQLRALAEHLPLGSDSFDLVVFATSLDHFVDPVQSLCEARRVCRPSGAICVWLGEKSPESPRPQASPEWYRGLHKPKEAEDPFHLNRLTPAETGACFERVGLEMLEQQILPAGPFRWNHFYRLKAE